MRVFISGATGVLGRRVVRGLTGGEHAVVGLSRSQANSDWLADNGAEPRVGDLFDQDGIADLTSDCDVVLHLATAIPTKSRSTRADWQTNDRIRRDGTRILVEAARRNGCRLYVQESITLIYGEQGEDWIDEHARIPDRQPSILHSAVDMERIVMDAVDQHELPAIILRFGSFYSHDSAQTRAMLQLVHRGLFPIVGDGRYYTSLINAEDAAAAVVKAIENHEAGLGQVFNVCDDEPVRYGEMVRFIAETLDAKKPKRIPRFLAKQALGTHIVDAVFASNRCRNDLVKERLDWAPRYPTYREGYPAEIDQWQRSGQ